MAAKKKNVRTRLKRSERKNIAVGAAHIKSTFNNTIVSITDPSGRYAEHKKTEAFYDADVFYYQGTGFIHEVERLLVGEFRAYLGCPEVETRLVSGQMANTAVFSALIDYLNGWTGQAEHKALESVSETERFSLSGRRRKAKAAATSPTNGRARPRACRRDCRRGS